MVSVRGEIAFNETFYLISAVVVGLVVVIFVLSLLSGGKGWLDWACEEWPWICGDSDDTNEAAAARMSSRALSCAINYMTDGDTSGCDIRTFSGTTQTGGSSMQSDLPEGLQNVDDSDYVDDGNYGGNQNKQYDPEFGTSGYPGSQTELPGGLSFTGNIGANYHDFITGMATTSTSLSSTAICGSGFEVRNERTQDCGNCYKICEDPRKTNCRCVEDPKWYTVLQNYQCQWIEEDSGSDVKCYIKNFHLPQKITGITEWINAVGDPRFLLYYQNFPEGEDDAWNGWSTWMESSRSLIFLTSCIWGMGTIFLGKIPTKAVTSEITESTAQGIFSKVAKSYDDFTAKYLANLKIKKITVSTDKFNLVFGNFKKLASSASIGKAAFLEKLRAFKNLIPTKTISDAYSKYEVLIKTGAYTGEAALLGLTMSEYVERRVATEFGKFYPVEGMLMLQEPLREEPLASNKVLSKIDGTSNPEEFKKRPLIDLGRPILLDKGDLDYITPFYLASPCHADLIVRNKSIYCSSYTYNDKTGSVRCDTPSGWKTIVEGANCGAVGDDYLDRLIPNETVRKDVKEKVIETIASDGGRVLQMSTSQLSIKDPVYGYTFEFEYDSSLDIACCQYQSKKEWALSSTCTGVLGGNVVADSECIAQSKDLQVGYPLRIKSIKNPSGNVIKSIDIGFIGEWPCILRDPLLEKGLDGSKLDVNDTTFQDDMYSTHIFGIGKYVSCEINSSYWEGVKELEDRYGSLRKMTGALSSYGSSIYFMAEIDDSNTPKRISGIGMASVMIMRSAGGGTTMELPNIFSFVDSNSDSKVDVVTLMRGWDTKTSKQDVVDMIRFSDFDSDGEFDSLEQRGGCNVDSLYVTAEKRLYTDEEGYEYNFCHSEISAWGYAATVGMFMSDIALKKALTFTSAGWSYLAGVAVDCALSYVSVNYGNTKWPGKQ